MNRRMTRVAWPIAVTAAMFPAGAAATDVQLVPHPATAEVRLKPAPAGSGLRWSAAARSIEEPGGTSWPGRVALFGLDPYLLPSRDAAPVADTRIVQFQLPSGPPRSGGGPAKDRARALPRELPYQYAFGSDSELTIVRNSDLNNAVRDHLRFAAPTGFFLGTVRPTNWLDANFELTFEQQIRIKEEPVTQLPNGDTLLSENRRGSLLIDQANVVFKNIPDHPLEITVGRRNFEDPRLFLYDAALDGVHAIYNSDTYSTEISVTRETRWDLDLVRNVQTTRIDNYILYHEYRGIEDHKLAAYAIARPDKSAPSAQPKFYGLRAFGRPSDEFNYWAELAKNSGVDETGLALRGKAFDFGGTYRFPKTPFAPCFTVGLAYGSGDSDDTDNKNRQHRQTDLQSNETRFCGVTQFKRYGEFADLELSNLRIQTFGFGFRAAASVFIDLVYQRYRLSQIANEFRSSGITAEMNNVNGRLDRHVGQELDVILGLRNFIPGSRVGFEARAGVFFPGNAYLRDDGTQAAPLIRKANRGISVLAVLIY